MPFAHLCSLPDGDAPTALALWVISSVGLEHYLDRVGVTGSNPVLPTFFRKLIPSLHDPIRGCPKRALSCVPNSQKFSRP